MVDQKHKPDPHEADARATLKKQAEARAKLNEETAKRMSARPTPTQEELDLANLGVHLLEHEDDGSGPEPRYVLQRTFEPQQPPSGYQTREAKPASTPLPPKS